MHALPEAVARRCSVKKVFLEISQNSQENTCARVSFFYKNLGWLLLHYEEYEIFIFRKSETFIQRSYK